MSTEKSAGTDPPLSSPRPWILFRVITFIERALLYASLLAIILISFTNVMMRNTGLGGLIWADRVLVLLVLCIAVLGSSIAAGEKKHITIDLAYNIFPGRAHKHFRYISHTVSALAAGLLAYFSSSMTFFEYRAGLEVISGVGVWVPMSIMSFGFTLIAFRYASHSIREISSVFKKEKE